MKKYIGLFGILLMAWIPEYGCSICGGMAATGNYLGVLPQYQKHYIGLRYQFQNMELTHPPSIIPGQSGQKIREFRHSAELMGRWCPGKRWQIMAALPFHRLQSKMDAQNNLLQGMGDVNMTAYYSILSGKKPTSKGWYHLLQAGMGVKLPTGSYKHTTTEGDFLPGFQLGTGSTDVTAAMVYLLRRKKVGIMLDAGYTMNGMNDLQYQFGNKIIANGKLFYVHKRKQETWVAQVGSSLENMQADRLNGKIQPYTGSVAVFSLAGVDYFRKNINFGLQCRIPAYQYISEGYAKGNIRLTVAVLYLF